MLRLLNLIFLLLAFQLSAQNFADKSYYLVDSLEYDKISPEYQQLLDGYLQYYHNANDDLYRVSVIYEIVRNCWDANVWPKYNEWVKDFTAHKLKEDLPDSLRYTYNQLNIGTLYYTGWGYFNKTDYANAINSFEKCYNRYLEIGDEQGAANAIDNVGSMYSTIGEVAKALEYHTKGLKIREEINDTLGLGASYNAIGIIHMSHGDYQMAIEDFEKAIAFHTHVAWWSGLSNEYSNLGNIHMDLGQHDLALKYHLESYRIKEILEDKQGMTISLANLARLNILNGDTATAIEYTNYGLQLSQELGDQRGIAGAKNYLGFIHFLKEEYESGVKHCKEALDIANEIGSIREKRSAMTKLFLGYLWWEKFEEAETYLEKLVAMRKRDIKVNFAVLPEQKKELYLNTVREEYQNLYAFGHFRKEKNPQITTILYDNTLLLKGLLLQSSTAMRDAILSSNNEALISKYNQWIAVKTDIADAYARGLSSDSLEVKANELEQDLVKKSASFDRFQTGKSAKWQDIQAKLDKNEAAIEFIRFPEVPGDPNAPYIYSALVVKANSKQPKMIELCTEDELEKILGKTSANNISFVNEVYGTREDRSQKLAEVVWNPLKESLEGISKINYAPDGLLHKVAFSAIKTDEDEFLCDQFELFQMGSTAEMLSTKKIDYSTDLVATLFGGVKYSTDSSEHVIWTYLPGSKGEVDSIQNILKNELKVNYFAALDATEKNFKETAEQSNIIHIATHGFFYPDPNVVLEETKKELDLEEVEFRGGASNYGIWNFVNNENPLMRSGLAMAAANDAWQRSIFAEGEDGVLSAQEVSNLNLRNTNLVVLSACETGLGDIRGSEGVYGLQRAFKMAGANYMIMSLWQVPDKETAEFMTHFYKALFEQKDIRKAFTETQQTMRKKYDPYFWAAFVLVE